MASDLDRLLAKALQQSPQNTITPQPQTVMDTAAMATSPIPGLGDILGLIADGSNLTKDPSVGNALAMMLGAVPFAPGGSTKRLLENTQDINKLMRSKRKKLTPSEKKWFKEIFDSEADKMELLEEVPGVEFDGEYLTIPREMENNLHKYIEDTRILEGIGTGGEGAHRLPPSFNRGDFIKKMK